MHKTQPEGGQLGSFKRFFLKKGIAAVSAHSSTRIRRNFETLANFGDPRVRLAIKGVEKELGSSFRTGSPQEEKSGIIIVRVPFPG